MRSLTKCVSSKRKGKEAGTTHTFSRSTPVFLFHFVETVRNSLIRMFSKVHTVTFSKGKPLNSLIFPYKFTEQLSTILYYVLH